MDAPPYAPLMPPETRHVHILKQLERKLLWLSAWMIHNANHIRPNRDGLKVGGHQASCASCISIMAALYFEVARPQDRIAVKPHAGPVFHAINYLFGRQTRREAGRRCASSAASSPIRRRVKDGAGGGFLHRLGRPRRGDDQLLRADGRTTSACTGSAATDLPPGRHIAIAGDAELDEGNIYEALLEGWKHDVRNVWWIVDYNRQSLEFRRARPAVRPHRGPVPRHGLELRHHQIRPQAGGGVRARGRRGAARAGSTTARTASIRR